MTKLWCVYFIGMDEVVAAPSYEAAAKRAMEINEAMSTRYREALLTDPNMPWIFACPREYPWSAEDHAAALIRNPEMAA